MSREANFSHLGVHVVRNKLRDLVQRYTGGRRVLGSQGKDEMRRRAIRFKLSLAMGALSTVLGSSASAQSPGTHYTGNVVVLEVWRTGNVVFTIDVAGLPCNGHFILNKSDPGTKDAYAMLLSAKSTDRTVRVYFDVCGPAEGGSGNFAQIQFLRLN